ncbi:uncharacterized protein CC84DRAFT_1257383 [Paraphaeosphaeria sporulosa]|uniref:Uncharacterized protein n=1 Tax=Paraphaeosphaeria sporulosa TaxID=1460663 RepID=A0A177CP19_9PLEO|nr:uncharacterized protein CC84DRAFT_1257383 [Paraphaeosphaeria sporulosa]OAG08539.1 hypothetical protein CC84DRAFT_1257383 [Paraphaeosphaeria sporulosa]
MEAIQRRSDSVVAVHTNPTNDGKQLQFSITDVAPGSSSSTPAIAPDATDVPAKGAVFQLPAPLQQGWPERRIHRWKSPIMMVVFFLVGLAMSLAHCIFYPSLKGKVVGNSDAQEEKIRQVLSPSRVVTVANFSDQIRYCLLVHSPDQPRCSDLGKLHSVAMAYGEKEGNDRGRVECSFWSRYFGALAAESGDAAGLLLPPFFTPATLFVYQSLNVESIDGLMPFPHIANATPSVGSTYSYSPPARRGRIQFVDDVSRVFVGPRTIVSLIASATASLGEILPIKLPYQTSSHEIEFHAPIVQCLDANTTAVELIESFRKQDMAIGDGVVVETDSVYYAFIPSYNETGDLYPVLTPRLQTRSNASNELWMTFLRPVIKSGERVTERRYQVCKLHNATYNLRIARDLGLQNISKSYTINEQVHYPRDNSTSISNMAQHAYTAFMWALCDQLVGKFSWYNNTAWSQNSSLSSPSGAAQFGVLQSPISRTSLLGSLDLDAFFDLDEANKLYSKPEGNGSLSDQRLMDKAMAKNRTLDVLIEELSFNISVGLMWDPLLTHRKVVPVNITTQVNRYAYKAHGLFIPYVLANISSLVIVIFGLWSYIRDGPMPDKKFQDLVSAAEDSSVVHIIRNRKRSVTAVLRNEKLVLQAGNSLDGNDKAGLPAMLKKVWHGGRGKLTCTD